MDLQMPHLVCLANAAVREVEHYNRLVLSDP